ncbi:MAG: efflux RND transporter periplasmic adaptor subunit [Vicinamibacterales bacterium]
MLASVIAASCSKGAEPGAAGAEAGGGRAGGGRAGGRGGGGPVPVVTGHSVVKAMPITIPAVGTAEPLGTVQLRAQVTGQLSRVHFAEGQEVRKGDTLFTLDSRPFEAALRQAEAVLARDTAQSKNAKSQQARYKELFDKGLIPRDQFETQDATAAALEATLAADQSLVENARLSLQYTVIKAPIAGRTGALAVHAGDLVRANDTAPLVVINQLAPIYVSFSVPGRYLPEIRQGQAKRPLQIQVRDNQGDAPGAPQVAPPAPGSSPTPGNGGQPASSTQRQTSMVREGGVVSFIDNAVDPTTGTIKLKGTFDNADHALWPGLFVQVTLVLGSDPSAVVVPAAAVQASQAGQYVFIVNAERTVEMRTVKIARQQGEEMVVAEGLKGGEEVVTDGHLRLTPGARVSTGTRGQGAGSGGERGERGGAGGTGEPGHAGGGRRGSGGI